jgi:hypothetical protein
LKSHKQQKPNRVSSILKPAEFKKWESKKKSLELKQSKLKDTLNLLQLHQKNTINILKSKKKSSSKDSIIFL